MQIDRSKKFSEFFESSQVLRKIDFLVLHHVQANSAEHAISQFREHQVSSHFLIDESGVIFELVDENDVAYHAGVSFWRGVESLNKFSIGVEFINSSPFLKKFSEEQMIAGVSLCKYLAAKYQIAPENIVGHSDIAYDKTTGLLDRKQDPSHLFDWKFLAENGVGLDLNFKLGEGFKDEVLFGLGDKDPEIATIKQKLKKFGYRLINLSDEFDAEMQAVVRVFNRRFNQSGFVSDADKWCVGAQKVLSDLIKN